MILKMMTMKEHFWKWFLPDLGDNNEATFIVNKDNEYSFAASNTDEIAKSSDCRRLFTKDPSSEV